MLQMKFLRSRLYIKANNNDFTSKYSEFTFVICTAIFNKEFIYNEHTMRIRKNVDEILRKYGSIIPSIRNFSYYSCGKEDQKQLLEELNAYIIAEKLIKTR